MPRKAGTAKLQEFEIRITPTDQLPITEEQFRMAFEKAIEYVIAEEGEPNGEPKLHYHGYVKAKLSETYMSMQCSILGRATDEIKGNSVFMCKPEAHENLQGYVTKGQKIVATTYDQTTLEMYFEKSEKYNREKAAKKKAASRSSEKSLDDIMKTIVVNSSSTPYDLVSQILKEYSKLDKKFPPRTQIEAAVLKKLYSENEHFVVSFYAKNMDLTKQFSAF